MIKKINENNATQILVFLALAPVAIVLILAICLMGKEVFQQIWEIITSLWKIVFPSFETALAVIIIATYNLVLGFVLAVVLGRKNRKDNVVEMNRAA